MPQVPVYQDRQVRTQALQPVFQNTPDVSSGARALAQGLGQVAEVADRIDLRDSQDAAFKAQAVIREEWGVQRAALRKAYAKDNADQYKVEADKWWAEAKTKYTAELNPRAQALAGRAIGDFKLAQDNDTIAYVESEKGAARKVNYETLQSKLITETGQNITPENARAMSAYTAKQITENAIRYAAAEGFKSDVGEKMARDELNRFHADVAVSLASKPGGAAAAKEYLNEFGKDIPLGVRTRIDGVVKKEFNDQEGKRVAQSLAALPYGERLKKLSGIDDPELREAATGHVEQDQQRIDRARTAASRELLGQAKLAYEKGGKVPAAVMTALEETDPGAAADLMRGIRADQKARAAEAQGKEIKTDYAAWQHAYDRIAQGEQVDLLQYRGTVSRSDLMGLRKELENRNKPDAEKDVATTNQISNTYTAGWPQDKKGAFSQAFLDEIDKFKNEKKRTPTYKEKRDIGDRLVINGEVLSGSMFLNDPNKKYYEATPEERARFAPTITSGDRKLVKDALMAEGIKNPTEAQIVQRFKLAKGFR